MRTPLDPVAPRTDPFETPTGSLRQLANVTQRRWPFLLVTVVAAVAVALVLSHRQQPRYQAESTVQLLQNNVGSSLVGLQADQVTDPTALARLAQNQADAADNIELATSAQRAAGFRGTSAEQLRAETDIAPSNTADILKFTVTSPSSEVAVKGSRAWAEQYIGFRQRTDVATIKQAISQVNAQLAKIRGQESQQGLYEDLRSKAQQLRSLEVLQTPNARVASLASGATQTAPKTKRNALLALAIGLLLGVILMFAREALDRRLSAPEQIEDILGTPFLGRIPASEKAWSSAQLQAKSLDRFDVLRAELALQLPATQDGASVVAVTGSGVGHGRANLAAGLALAWARAGRQVVLLNFDVVAPPTGALGSTEIAEVSPFLAGEAPFSSAVSWARPMIEPTSGDGGYVGVVAPPAATNGSLTLGDPVLRRLVDEARKVADIVVVQTASLTESGVAVTAAGLSDAAVIVVRGGDVTEDALVETRRVLGRLLPVTLGFVVADGGA
jgi:capsular polysaccharide biosynthesis protein